MRLIKRNKRKADESQEWKGVPGRHSFPFAEKEVRMAGIVMLMAIFSTSIYAVLKTGSKEDERMGLK